MKSKLKQHNNNATDEIFLVKEIIMAVFKLLRVLNSFVFKNTLGKIKTCLKLLVVFCFSDNFTAT